MSWSERHVQDHRLRTDRAIHHACAQLALDPPAFTKFQEILLCARQRATRLFEAPVHEGRHTAVDALVHLARFRHSHIRPAIDWPGTTASWRPAIASSADHLISRYKVPAFLASAWYTTGDEKRNWFVAHSNGASFRSLNLPIAMTRKMEHLFLASQDHLPIEAAIRRAELLALGAPVECVKAVLSTQLATDLRHGDFWRTVWLFLIANTDHLDPTQIAPLIDYIQAVRHDRTQEGLIEFGPPQPAFSMKGRTVPSMLRLMQDWHRSLGAGGVSVSWAPSPFHPALFEEPIRDESELPRRWQIMELVSSAQLRREGAELHHCVASYAPRCQRGASSIWSLRLWQAERMSHVLTIEIDPRKRTVIQARGRANRTATGKPLQLLHDWALRERLSMAI